MTADSNLFLSQTNEKKIKQYLNDALAIVLKFKNREKVSNFKSCEYFLNKYVEKLPEEEGSLDILKGIVGDLLDESVNFSSKMFMGFPDAGNSIAGIIGGIIESTCQQNLLNSDFSARSATFIEICTVRWCRELIGYQNDQKLTDIKSLGGVATTGGTCSNMYGLLMARKRAYPESFSRGLPKNASPKIFIPSDITHYSVSSSAGMIGLGTESIEKVKTKNFFLDLVSLENQLKKSKKNGDQILSVVLNAGDSRTLTIDPLREAIEIVRSIEPLAWVHVDACHGGQLLFSHKHKERICGIELADSISLDPHKVFNLPYALSYFLFKDPREIEGFWTSSSLITSDPWALGQLTPNIGSKTWSTLKFYLLLKHLGAQQLGNVIDNRIEMANKFRAIVARNPHFKLLTNHSDLNSVPFFYARNSKTDFMQSESFLYALNEKIYKNMLRQGDFYLHGFPIRDDCNILGLGREHRVFVLRYMCGNPTTQEEDLETLMTKLCAVAEETVESFDYKNLFDPA